MGHEVAGRSHVSCFLHEETCEIFRRMVGLIPGQALKIRMTLGSIHNNDLEKGHVLRSKDVFRIGYPSQNDGVNFYSWFLYKWHALRQINHSFHFDFFLLISS